MCYTIIRKREGKPNKPERKEKMKIYKLNALIFDYWYDMDRSGYQKEEHYFSSREKAEAWAEAHKNFCYGFSGNEAVKSYEFPKFEIEEIEVE